MIKYSLVCDGAHEFESWFRDSEAFEKQAKRGLVSCPTCGSIKVGKAVMAPSVARTDRAPSVAAATPSDGVALLDPAHKELREKLRELHRQIEANSVDVGEKFPEEARRMHEGAAPERSIRGQASLAEAKALLEEGIPVLPIPGLPDERN